jgi:hypothetical protein
MKKPIRTTSLFVALMFSGCDFEHQAATEMVSTTQSRPLGTESSLDADISFGIGNLEISSDSLSVLYSLDLEYDKANFEPHVLYEAASGNRGHLSVKLESARHVGFRTKTQTNRLRLSFNETLPLELSVNAGVGQARLSLSRLKIKRLDMESGVGGAKISSYEPNPVECDRVRIRNGVGGMKAVGLGNLNFRELEFEGGVGGADLDFTGQWKQDAQVRIQVGVGGVSVRMPRDVGVEVDAEKSFLSGIHLDGFMKRNSRYYSESYDKAKVRVFMRVTTGVGGFRINWV